MKNSLARLFTSSVGLKITMAATGILLLLFVIAHLLGNLQIFLGKEAFNNYAAFLHSVPEFLWPARIGLLTIFVVHMILAFKLRSINKSARPISYQNQNTIQANPASLYMLETGLVILIFVIIHLLHFTFGKLQPEYFHLMDDKSRIDVYKTVIRGFDNFTYATLYIFSLLCLGTHLSHAISSAVHTLGFYDEYYTPCIRKASKTIGYGIALGYISIPLSVQLGILVGGF